MLALDAVHTAYVGFAERAYCARHIGVGPIRDDARSRSFLRPRTRRFSTRQMGSNAETSLAKHIALAGTSPIWQRSFFDHERYAQKWNYVRENPVRAGLVNNPNKWPYSGEIVIIERVTAAIVL